MSVTTKTIRNADGKEYVAVFVNGKEVKDLVTAAIVMDAS